MKLIVGLGNPESKYEKTRHNVGFRFVDYYFNDSEIKFKEKMNALGAELTIDGEKVIVIKPLTYMNLSGTAVKNYIDFYKIPIEDLLVVYDDTSFEVGKIKVKSSGSSAGHNGINDIINKLNTKDIKRIKIGIGKNNIELKDYVLGKFSNADIETLEKMFKENKDIIKDYVSMDFERFMSKYNK